MHRCLFHRHSIVRLEGDRHHAGQLLALVHPEIPAQTLLSSQLLQADLLELISKARSTNRKTRYWGVFVYLIFCSFFIVRVTQTICTCFVSVDAALKAAGRSRAVLDGRVSNIM